MSKSFRELIEALNARKTKEKAPTKGKVGGEPNTDGEKEFAKAHEYPVKKGGEYDRAYPTKNSDDVLNARKQKEVDMDQPGEKTPVEQGTSKLKDLSGFKDRKTVARQGDKSEGDNQILRKSPSAVQAFKEEKVVKYFDKKVKEKELEIKESEELIEDVASELNKIAESGKSGKINFKDGDTTNVSPVVAKKMMETYNQLNSENAKKFRETINKDATGFLKMMNFSLTQGESLTSNGMTSAKGAK